MARPSDYSPEITLAICARLVEGESLRSICRDESMPGQRTVFTWLETHEEFQQQYARAREMQAEFFADEMLDIADDAGNDWMERNDKENPGWVANGENIQRSRVRIDTRKWIASKLLPKKYGDKLALGSDSESPLELKAHVTLGSPAALQRAHELLARALAIGSPGADASPDPNGPVLPAAVRAGAVGYGASLAAGENPGSPE